MLLLATARPQPAGAQFGTNWSKKGSQRMSAQCVVEHAQADNDEVLDIDKEGSAALLLENGWSAKV